MTDISETDFVFYQSLLIEKSGLSLTPEKAYLLKTRLTPVAQSLGFKTLENFTQEVRAKKDKELVRAVMEAMTTNETSFFRDTKPFTILQELLPALTNSRQHKKVIRIWSAACSSGQECYSIAMVMQEFLKNKPDWKCQIIGTDISEDILQQARKGEYSQFEVQRGLTIQMMLKHFEQRGTVWHIKDELKAMVQFKQLNLLDDMSSMGAFDFIFCRNVLIYFNKEAKEKTLTKLSRQLASDGCLFLGACETIINLNVPLQPAERQLGVFSLKKDEGIAKSPIRLPI